MFVLSIITVVILGIFIYRKATKVDYLPTAYESELIEYFEEIALKSEIDKNINETIKWNKSMSLYVVKDKPYKRQMASIKKAIEGVNYLATDGFRIELTEDKTEKNAILYLSSRNDVEDLDYHFLKGINGDFAGLSEARYNWRNHIISAKIFIDIEESIEVQESVILEELTQSIGLMNDSEKYPNSIFYEKQMAENIHNNKYSPIDKDVIKLLYHHRMKSGLNSEQVKNVIKRILKNKEVELAGS